MGREKPETRRAREKRRYADDPDYRERLKQQRRAHYEANAEAIKERSRRHRKSSRESVRAMELKRRYGLTLDEWHALLVAQSGRCAICADPMKSPHVDHCHAGGQVRGLLCTNCNTGLGKFRDCEDLLARAIVYLKKG